MKEFFAEISESDALSAIDVAEQMEVIHHRGLSTYRLMVRDRERVLVNAPASNSWLELLV